ncbi:hypothetical protein DS6A_92 [Mycobacterium phage DS6A]|uniref:Uncharacterized protein n=1 Tax=Mycobacterium phage DS6A TaxID=45764 RepID=G8I4K2_9CAUD|nr:hypothetical protein DS6A_92 [Mycobacterium phage DS6A]AER47646.1 hypothetical protein DS6A_92 [Mycobacterium phage DS6A]
MTTNRNRISGRLIAARGVPYKLKPAITAAAVLALEAEYAADAASVAAGRTIAPAYPPLVELIANAYGVH